MGGGHAPRPPAPVALPPTPSPTDPNAALAAQNQAQSIAIKGGMFADRTLATSPLGDTGPTGAQAPQLRTRLG